MEGERFALYGVFILDVGHSPLSLVKHERLPGVPRGVGRIKSSVSRSDKFRASQKATAGIHPLTAKASFAVGVEPHQGVPKLCSVAAIMQS